MSDENIGTNGYVFDTAGTVATCHLVFTSEADDDTEATATVNICSGNNTTTIRKQEG